MLLQLVVVVGCAMIGSEEEQIVALAHLLVELRKERRQVLVQLHVYSLVLRTASTYGMTDDVGRRNADGEHVSLFVLSHLLVHEYSLSHLECHGHSLVLALQVIAWLGTVLLVEVLDPLWQIVHIVCAGHEVACLGVPPVCRVSRMACGQYGGAVLQRHTYHLRLPVGSQLQLVAYGRGDEVAWRHLSLLRVRSDAPHGAVAAAVYGFAVDEEVVAADAMQGGCRAGIYARVAYGCDGGDIRYHVVLTREALVDESLQSALAILIIIIVQVVPSHLVNHQSYNQFRAFQSSCSHDSNGHGAQHHKCNTNLFHYYGY